MIFEGFITKDVSGLNIAALVIAVLFFFIPTRAIGSLCFKSSEHISTQKNYEVARMEFITVRKMVIIQSLRNMIEQTP